MNYLEVQDFPGVFAIGDCALFVDPDTQRPFAPTAQIAEAQAKTAAKKFTCVNTKLKKENSYIIQKDRWQLLERELELHHFWE